MSFTFSEARSEVSPQSHLRSRTEVPGKEADSMRLSTRVSKACERCRRHKSRCDEFRPCSLCRRANVQCVPTTSGPGRPQKKRRMPNTPLDNGESFFPGSSQRTSDNNSHDESSGDGIIRGADHSSPNVTNRDDPQSTSSTVPTSSPVDYREAESIIGLARKIFQSSSQSLDNLATSAIPDGQIPGHPSNSGQATPHRFPISSVLGCSLPPEGVMRMLLEDYFESVHWFSLVIYEPKFRAQFESICDGHARPSQKPFLLLLSTVLGIAAWYCSKRPSAFQETGVDWNAWASNLIKHTESQLFDIIDHTTLANIQTCILLGSYNSYHGKPTSAFALLGATIKTAQAMGLHRESLRDGFENSEERKRTWWTIYTWDRWASITYGRPLGINDKDCNVPMPGDVYENRQFKAISPEEDDELVCYSAYQRELNQLYMIASPMIETIFGIRSSSSSTQQAPGNLYRNLMKDVSWQLSGWRQRLPPHLIFDFDHDIAPDASATLKAHRLQALALQLTFDSLVIIFHRPFLAQQVLGFSQGNWGTCLSPSQNSSTFSSDPQVYDASDLSSSQRLPSSEHWWSAAVRTSRVIQLPQTARLAIDGHLVAFLGINLFNSAVVMVACALSDPLSDRAQEAKRNITRISRLQELLGKRSKLSMQSSVILRDMIWMIFRREAEAMLASIQPPKEPNGGDTSDEGKRDSPNFSLEDALRLPLSVAADHVSHSGFPTALHENAGLLLDETLRLNESLASLQWVFPGNEVSALQQGNGSQDELSERNYEWNFNMERRRSNFQLYNVNTPGKRAFEYDGGEDDLYWIWNSADCNATWPQ